MQLLWSLQPLRVLAGLVPAIHAVPLSRTSNVVRKGAACGRMLRIRLGMPGTSPGKTTVGKREQKFCF
jgi:hypothetical protein